MKEKKKMRSIKTEILLPTKRFSLWFIVFNLACGERNDFGEKLFMRFD